VGAGLVTGLEWMSRAACRDLPQFTELDPAEQVPTCVQCPVRAECGLYGIETQSTYVMFGGRIMARYPTVRRH